MAKTANCPSCGAPVAFRAAASAYAVCEFCRSILVRQDEGVKNIGRMADLLEDGSPIHLGTEGRLRSLHFAVVGRIQLQYGAGFWNEWHILLDDGRSAWLSEAGGEYTVTRLAQVAEPIPEFSALQPGTAVMLQGHAFTVSDLETARCVAGEGELPFKVGAGYDVQAADLRGEGRFASIDYSETPPLVFMGEAVAFADLKLSNLRQPTGLPAGQPLAPGRVKAFTCPKCGAALGVHSKKIEVVVCASCGVTVDANDPNYRIIAAAARAARVEPNIPLASTGRLAGADWEVIGFMGRQATVEGIAYPWNEYLLFDARSGGFAWLVEEQGHWTFVRTISDVPKTGASPTPVAWWQHQSFKHFQSAEAEVTYVVGEFYWRVKVGERVRGSDYVLPPRILSEERSDKEITWSAGDYMEPEEIWQAFKLKDSPPPRIGVGACQPNPHEATHRLVCARFWKLSAAALALQLGFLFFAAGSTVSRQTLVFHAGNNEPVTTAPFTLERGANNLVVSQHTDLDNAWLQLNLTLIEQKTGDARSVVREISRYHGYEDGENWSEGDRDDNASFGAVPPGTYYLAIDAEAPGDLRESVADTLQVARNKAGWVNFGLLEAFLTLWPLASRWRMAAFEAQRWAESDHPPGDGGEA